MSTTTYKRLLLGWPIAVGVLAVCTGLALSSVLGADLTRAPRRLSVYDGPAASKQKDLQAVLKHHDASQSGAAIAIWDTVSLSAENRVWRHVALAVAHLYENRYQEAELELREASLRDSETAIVHYFTGLLSLSRAELVDEFPDAIRNSPFRLVSSNAGLSKAMHRLRFSKAKSRYQLEAMAALENAIQFESSTDYGAPLLVSSATPTVDDLLTVLGADNFVGKAHGLLAHLNLERGHPERAELHIDNAKTRGIPVPYGYRLVGEQYEDAGRTVDSERAYAKANREGDVLASPKEVDERMAELLRQLIARSK